MGVVYYQYKSEKEINSMPVPHAFIPVSKLKQLILTSERHGRGRTRGRGLREDIIIYNAAGEEYADESALVLQNSTVLVRRIAGQLPEKIVLSPSRKVTEGDSVVTDLSSKSCSSEVQDEDAAIAAVIDAAELKLEGHPSKRGPGSGRFTSGHGRPLEGETPPPGYVCRLCGIPGHFIQHCPQESKTPPSGYVCFRCRTPGHFIHHCPTIGDPKFDNYKMNRLLAPVVTVSPTDGILEALVPAVPVNAVDELPGELHCQLCKKVMIDAVLTSKCCFDSFCDKCIRDYIITQSKCICGAKALADDLIPNQTLRSTISNMLVTRTSSTTSGTTNHRSSSGSNPDPKLQSHPPAAASEMAMKQSTDLQLSAGSAPKGDLVNQPLEKLAANVDLLSKDEGISAEVSAEKAAASTEVPRVEDGSGLTFKVTTVSGALEHKATRADQPKKKRKKADSTKIVQPNNFDYGYNSPFDPAYYNPLISGYPWVTDPYMYGSMGMPYSGYPMDPYGYSINGIPPHVPGMQGYPENYHRQVRQEAQPTHHHGTEAVAARSRPAERPKHTRLQPQSSELNQQLGSSLVSESRNRTRSSAERRDHGRSDRAADARNQQLGSHGSESRSRTRSSSERRYHGRSDRAADDYYEDHHSSRKRIRVSSPMEDDKQSSRRSRHGSRSATREEDPSDDERNFKRSWGRRSSVTRH